MFDNIIIIIKEMVRIHSWEEFLSYPKSKWGYPEPSGMTEDTIGINFYNIYIYILYFYFIILLSYNIYKLIIYLYIN